MPSGRHMGRLEWALIVILSLFWGASFFFFKVLVGEMGPFTIVLGRMGIATLVMNLILTARGERLPPFSAWLPFFIMGFLVNVLPFSLIAYGEKHISSGLASIVNAMTPISTVLVAHWWTQSEKLSWNKIAGVLCGVAGVTILIGPSVLEDIGGRNLLGQLACLAATVSYGFGGVYGHRFSEQSLFKVVTAQMTASSILVLPLAAGFEQPWALPMPSLPVWGALFGIALVSTVAASLIFFHILAKAGATNLSLVNFLLPVSAVFLGVAFLGESVNTNAIAGMLVIGLGLAFIDGRPLRWLRQRFAA
jgi:drug/metabolite transporter (DMT)-like permease